MRYFFHTEDGRSCHDEDGAELPDVAAAKRTAIKVVCEMLPDLSDFWETCSFTVICTDENDLRLFQVDVGATVAPAVAARAPA
jgi:hypothetical protein